MLKVPPRCVSPEITGIVVADATCKIGFVGAEKLVVPPGSERKVKLLYASYAKYFGKHYNHIYSLIVRLMYAWRYGIIFTVNLIRSKLNPAKRESLQKKYNEAKWIVKYSLFPYLTTR